MSMKAADYNRQAQLIIGNFLRWGVLTAAAIVTWGGIIYLSQAGLQKTRLTRFIGVPQALTNVDTILAQAIQGRGEAIIQAGLLVLILVPVLRVILSVFIFMLERDWVYVGITLLVLILLLFSLTFGSA